MTASRDTDRAREIMRRYGLHRLSVNQRMQIEGAMLAFATTEQQRTVDAGRDAVAVLRSRAAEFRKAAEQQGKRVGPRARSFEDAANYLPALSPDTPAPTGEAVGS